MPARIYATKEFTRIARKAKIGDASLVAAIEGVERGIVDADLGGGLLKLRIARPNEGKSGGYRTLVAYVAEGRAIFLFAFAKNEMENVGSLTEETYRDTGAGLQERSDVEIERLMEKGDLREIER